MQQPVLHVVAPHRSGGGGGGGGGGSREVSSSTPPSRAVFRPGTEGSFGSSSGGGLAHAKTSESAPATMGRTRPSRMHQDVSRAPRPGEPTEHTQWISSRAMRLRAYATVLLLLPSIL